MLRESNIRKRKALEEQSTNLPDPTFISFQEKVSQPITEIIEKYLQGDKVIIDTLLLRINFKSAEENTTLSHWLSNHPRLSKNLFMEELTSLELYILASLQFTSDTSVDKRKVDRSQAKMYMERSADLGNSLAMFWLGMDALFWENFDAAKQFINRAIDNKCGEALVGKALLYRTWDERIEDMIPIIVETYQQAAQQGSSMAYYHLAGLYAIGFGVNRDVQKAVVYLKQSAVMGNPMSLLQLAELYATGEVEAPSSVTPIIYCEYLKLRFRYSEESVYARTSNCLSKLYRQGKSVPQDKGKAADILRETLVEIRHGTTDARMIKDSLSELLQEKPVNGEVCFHALLALRLENTEYGQAFDAAQTLDDVNRALFINCFINNPSAVLDYLLQSLALSRQSSNNKVIATYLQSTLSELIGNDQAHHFFTLYPFQQDPEIVAMKLREFFFQKRAFHTIGDFFPKYFEVNKTNISVAYHLFHMASIHIKKPELHLAEEYIAFQVLITGNIYTLLRLCNNEPSISFYRSFDFISKDCQGQIGLILSVAYSALLKWTPIQDECKENKLPLDLVKMIFSELVGENVAKEFLNKTILADATTTERKANLTLIKLKEKLQNPECTHRLFSHENSRKLSLIKQAEDGQCSNVKALEFIMK